MEEALLGGSFVLGAVSQLKRYHIDQYRNIYRLLAYRGPDQTLFDHIFMALGMSSLNRKPQVQHVASAHFSAYPHFFPLILESHSQSHSHKSYSTDS